MLGVELMQGGKPMKLAAWCLLFGCRLATGAAVITPGPDMGDVNRNILGMNQVWYRSGHGVMDVQTGEIPPEMLRLTREAGIRVQRFPGGCATHFFNWKESVGKRPPNSFGFPEFLALCEKTGAIPVITLPDYAGTPEEMAELVEYLNMPDDGKHPYAAMRAGDGHPEPYNVIYFECGNETYHGPHRPDVKTMSPLDYPPRFLAFRKAMKAVDPRIKLGMVFHHRMWNAPMLEKAAGEIDFIIPHIYIGDCEKEDSPGDPDQVFRILLGGVNAVSHNLKAYRRELKEAGIERSIPIAVTEFNCHLTQDKPFPWRLSLGGALVASEIMRQMFYDPEVIMANYWLWSNEFWGMVKGFRAPYVERPAYQVFRLYHDYLLDVLVKPGIECRTFDSPGGLGLPAASGKPGAVPKTAVRNLLPQQRWSFLEEDAEFKKAISQRELPDGTLEVEFRDGSQRNYFHAVKRMPASPLHVYEVSAEIRVEGMADSTGAMIQIGDGRGYDRTRSFATTPGVKKGEWIRVSGVYVPLADTNSLMVQARRVFGREPGKMWIRNVRVTQTLPENLGASPLVEATVSRSKNGEKLAFVVINKSLDAAEPLTLAVKGVRRAKAETLTGPSAAATNEDTPGCVAVRPLAADVKEGAVTLLLPPHSLTGIILEK